MTRRDRSDADSGQLLFDLPLEPPDRPAPPKLSEIVPELAPREPVRARPGVEQATEVAAQPELQQELPSFSDTDSSDEDLRGSYSRALDSQTVGSREPIIAHLWPRILSSGADLLVHAGALAAVALGIQFMTVEPRLEHWPSYLAFMTAFSYLYTVVALAFWGQTAGMAWFGLAARESPQFPLSFAQATIRWLAGLITLALAGLPLLLALGGSSLSDRMSRSKTYQGFPAPG